jgi:hypothetical protein
VEAARKAVGVSPSGWQGLCAQKEEDYRSEIIFLQKVGGELKSRVKYLELELASVQRQHEAAARERVRVT